MGHSHFNTPALAGPLIYIGCSIGSILAETSELVVFGVASKRVLIGNFSNSKGEKSAVSHCSSRNLLVWFSLGQYIWSSQSATLLQWQIFWMWWVPRLKGELCCHFCIKVRNRYPQNWQGVFCGPFFEKSKQTNDSTGSTSFEFSRRLTTSNNQCWT